MTWLEVQVDRVVGPTHHFGGLGVGNVASQDHRGQVSNPAAAALQGLDKMRQVALLGIPQWILPPPMRPDLSLLRNVGFSGSLRDLLRCALDDAPEILSAAMSCSAMWTANAATVTPSCDNRLGTSFLSVANLNSSLHRTIEPQSTMEDLLATLPESFQVLPPLVGGAAMRDEGAANHMRLATPAGPGIHVWVYGDGDPTPKRFWPRQSLAACRAIARRHGLDESLTCFLKQHPKAIDAGAFHNDVVAMSDHDLLIHHELAYDTGGDPLQQIEDRFQQRTGQELTRIVVEQSQLSMDEAVETYLFNSQILARHHEDGLERILLCPRQVERNGHTLQLVQQWHQAGIFTQVHYVDLEQSMDAGGGPACLRLRVPIQLQELGFWSSRRRWSESLDAELRKTIQAYYPTRLTLQDLGCEEFVRQAMDSTNRIAQILSVR